MSLTSTAEKIASSFIRNLDNLDLETCCEFIDNQARLSSLIKVAQPPVSPPTIKPEYSFGNFSGNVGRALSDAHQSMKDTSMSIHKYLDPSGDHKAWANTGAGALWGLAGGAGLGLASSLLGKKKKSLLGHIYDTVGGGIAGLGVGAMGGIIANNVNLRTNNTAPLNPSSPAASPGTPGHKANEKNQEAQAGNSADLKNLFNKASPFLQFVDAVTPGNDRDVSKNSFGVNSDHYALAGTSLARTGLPKDFVEHYASNTSPKDSFNLSDPRHAMAAKVWVALGSDPSRADPIVHNILSLSPSEYSQLEASKINALHKAMRPIQDINTFTTSFNNPEDFGSGLAYSNIVRGLSNAVAGVPGGLLNLIDTYADTKINADEILRGVGNAVPHTGSAPYTMTSNAVQRLAEYGGVSTAIGQGLRGVENLIGGGKKFFSGLYDPVNQSNLGQYIRMNTLGNFPGWKDVHRLFGGIPNPSNRPPVLGYSKAIANIADKTGTPLMADSIKKLFENIHGLQGSTQLFPNPSGGKLLQPEHQLGLMKARLQDYLDYVKDVQAGKITRPAIPAQAPLPNQPAALPTLPNDANIEAYMKNIASHYTDPVTRKTHPLFDLKQGKFDYTPIDKAFRDASLAEAFESVTPHGQRYLTGAVDKNLLADEAINRLGSLKPEEVAKMITDEAKAKIKILPNTSLHIPTRQAIGDVYHYVKDNATTVRNAVKHINSGGSQYSSLNEPEKKLVSLMRKDPNLKEILVALDKHTASGTGKLFDPTTDLLSAANANIKNLPGAAGNKTNLADALYNNPKTRGHFAELAADTKQTPKPSALYKLYRGVTSPWTTLTLGGAAPAAIHSGFDAYRYNQKAKELASGGALREMITRDLDSGKLFGYGELGLALEQELRTKGINDVQGWLKTKGISLDQPGNLSSILRNADAIPNRNIFELDRNLKGADPAKKREILTNIARLIVQNYDK